MEVTKFSDTQHGNAGPETKDGAVFWYLCKVNSRNYMWTTLEAAQQQTQERLRRAIQECRELAAHMGSPTQEPGKETGIARGNNPQEWEEWTT